MSRVELEASLDETVEKLSEKAQRAREAHSLDSRVNATTQNIKHLARELRRIERKVTELLFYDGVAVEVFDLDRLRIVTDGLESVRETANVPDESLIEVADAGDLRGLVNAVDDRASDIDKARTEVIERIRSRQDHWQDEIAAARDLNQLIGGGASGFDRVLGEMDEFLGEEIWDESRTPETLATRWDRLTSKWDENAGRHGWEEFQQEHELEDDTITALQQFATKGRVRLNELSVSVLEELKSVEELDSAIRLEIDTR